MKRVSVLWTKDKVRSECRITGHSDPIVAHVSYHAQSCTKHVAYVAIQGTRIDGHDFIDLAIEQGSRVIIHESPLDRYREDTLYIQHSNPRRVASLFCRNLAPRLPEHIIGITGTDGKSTTCAFLHHILNTASIRCGLLSTVSTDDGTGLTRSPHRQSTPEAPVLYPFLATCRKHGLEWVVLEATSHGLSEAGARLADIEFAGAIITNITSEHIEFHGSREQYIDAKMNLVRQVRHGGWIVVSHDFPYLDRVQEAKHPSVHLHTYEYSRSPVRHAESELIAWTIQSQLCQRTLRFSYQEMHAVTSIPYGPLCYAQNMLGALLGAVSTQNLSFSRVAESLETLPAVPGRFELVETPLPITVIIDFAHTEQSFESLFSHIREHRPHARLIALFGAAGERDRSKRAPLGRAAARWCDTIILTDEDPRGEPADQILDDIEQGIELERRTVAVQRIHDRRDAIAKAIAWAKPGDILLLLAKSHERTIQYRDHSIDWDERATVVDLTKDRGKTDA